MVKRVIQAIVVLAGSALLVQAASSQAPPGMLEKVPDSVEEILAEALRTNPDVLLAEAGVRTAEAELNQVRLKVTQEVVSLHYRRTSLKSAEESLARQLARIKQLHAVGKVTDDEVARATLDQAETQAKLAELEAQLRYLIGAGGSQRTAGSSMRTEIRKSVPPRRPEIPEKFRAVLSQVSEIEFENASLTDILGTFREITGLAIIFSAGLAERSSDELVTLRLGEAPLRDHLLALVDVCESDLCFVFRDYGILVVEQTVAEGLKGATIPPDVPCVPEQSLRGQRR